MKDKKYIGKDAHHYFAGRHLIIELWDAKNLNNAEHVELVLRQAIKDADATLLHIHTHHFGEDSGLTSVGILSESHISIHTWPEMNYAALDVFLCGTKNPYDVIPAIKNGFGGKMQIIEHKRGILE
ncbi:MAG: adenosylmethionine decarboxylase [Candidatus Gracilibacteria bacterium]|nr:adenosylmethionine decarboxylase [Candidatus Gracilibacteria bacterium]